MIPKTQTRTGKNGNCFAAALASILETGIPEFGEGDDQDYWRRVNRYLADHGVRYKRVPLSEKPEGYSTIEGISPRGGPHACVALKGKLVFDPHPQDGTNGGLADPQYYGTLEPIEDYRKRLHGALDKILGRAKDWMLSVGSQLEARATDAFGPIGTEFVATLGGGTYKVGEVLPIEGEPGKAMKVMSLEGKTAMGSQWYKFRIVAYKEPKPMGRMVKDADRRARLHRGLDRILDRVLHRALDDSDWVESEHPRGQPGNKGQFKGGGAGSLSGKEDKFVGGGTKKDINGPNNFSEPLEFYENEGFEPMNETMRGQLEPKKSYVDLINKVSQHIQKHTTTKDMTTFRAVPGKVGKWYAARKPGAIVVVDAFNSTSTSEKFVKGFGAKNAGAGYYVLNIQVPKGSHAADVFASTKQEKWEHSEEVLLDGGCRYQIVAVDKSKRRVTMRLLDKGVPRGEKKWNPKKQAKIKEWPALPQTKAKWEKAGLPDLSKIDVLNQDVIKKDKRLSFLANSPWSNRPDPKGNFRITNPLVAEEIKKRLKARK